MRDTTDTIVRTFRYSRKTEENFEKLRRLLENKYETRMFKGEVLAYSVNFLLKKLKKKENSKEKGSSK